MSSTLSNYKRTIQWVLERFSSPYCTVSNPYQWYTVRIPDRGGRRTETPFVSIGLSVQTTRVVVGVVEDKDAEISRSCVLLWIDRKNYIYHGSRDLNRLDVRIVPNW